MLSINVDQDMILIFRKNRQGQYSDHVILLLDEIHYQDIILTFTFTIYQDIVHDHIPILHQDKKL